MATYKTTPGSENDVLAHLRRLAEASRQKDGNLRYEYFRGVEDPQKFVILESYRTAADFQAHRESQHFQEIGVETIISLLHHPLVSTYDSPTGTSGIRPSQTSDRQ
ncbi:putative quinol monooxygenase [Paenarthrobacter nicotinovorans]|uniref:putative quinol monooxygenase n=1 Tax=Paenarthrobacter TaxID=1742992 RepID=UPI003DA5CB99